MPTSPRTLRGTDLPPPSTGAPVAAKPEPQTTASSADPLTTGSAGDRVPPPGTRRIRRPLVSRSARDVVMVVGLLLVAWQVVVTVAFPDSFALASPVQAIRQGWTDRELLATNTWVTLQVAAAGFVLGNLLALALAVLFVLSSLADRVLSQFALALYALPTLVLAPILKVFLDPQSTRIAVAALVVFFPTLVAATAGLRAASRDSLDLVRSLGGGRWTALYRVRLRGAMPGLFSGLRVAVPGALLGAIASEWLGADSGLGIFMVNALGYLNTARVYACVLLLVLVTVGGYALVGAGNRLVNSWQDVGRDGRR